MSPSTITPIALLSVSNKQGLVPLAKTLTKEYGFKLLSSGGTAKTLKEAKSKAKYKSKLIQNGLHIDDIIIINNEYLNNNIKYKSKDKLYISLEKDDSILDQDVVKQWNGYLRIHK